MTTEIQNDATPETPAADQPAQATPEPVDVPKEGTDWKSEARKWEQRAKKNSDDLAPLKEQFDALRAVFGDKAKGGSPEDVVKNLQTQVELLRRENEVNALARTHGITDEGDIARLSKIGDAELRADLAARLKPSPAAPAAPQADPGQGARPGPGTSRDSEYQKFFPNTR